MSYIYVALGGALGSVLRYAAGLWLSSGQLVGGFPVATFIVNLLGSLLIGIFSALALKEGELPTELNLLLITGFCGGFTTFSTFSLEGIELLRNGQLATFLLYTMGSVLLGLGFAWIGYALVRIAI